MRTILTAVMLVGANLALGQQETTELKSVEPIKKTEHAEFKGATHSEVNQSKSVTISKKPNQAQRVHDVAYYNEEIAKIDAQITAIETKVAHVNATPSEQTIANQNGWFQKMDLSKQELNQRRAILVQKRDNL